MVYILLADGFEECEALTPADLLLRAGYSVKLISIKSSLSVTGAHGIKFLADELLSALDMTKLEMLILPGGMPGADNLYNNEAVRSIVKRTADYGKYIGAICAAPSILGKLGLLNGKKATCFPGFEKYLDGAEYISAKTVKDGNILTAIGMGAAFDFGIEAIRLLSGDEKAEKIRTATLA